MIGGDCSGLIDLSGELSGDVNVTGDLTGGINVGDELAAFGRILVGGLLDSGVTIQKVTAIKSLISLRGIGSAGGVTVNASAGDFDSDGPINVGSGGTFPLPDVTFDGFIKVKKESGGPGGGDLNAPITVSGCHATSDALGICV